MANAQSSNSSELDCASERPRRRRGVRFSLRVLLALAVAAALPPWWLPLQLDQMAAEQSAIAALRSADVRVYIEPAEPRWFWCLVPNTLTPGPGWAAHVESDEIPRAITGAEMPAIGRLTRLKLLQVAIVARRNGRSDVTLWGGAPDLRLEAQHHQELDAPLEALASDGSRVAVGDAGPTSLLVYRTTVSPERSSMFVPMRDGTGLIYWLPTARTKTEPHPLTDININPSSS